MPLPDRPNLEYLKKLAKEKGDPYEGISLAFVNPVTGAPGTPGFGTLAQGFLESSNVNIAEEMVNMISASRSYQNNVEVMNSTRQLMQKTLDSYGSGILVQQLQMQKVAAVIWCWTGDPEQADEDGDR